MPISLGLRRRWSDDAYVAAFTLPDFLNYIVAGGAASITFISIYTRFLAEKRDEDAQKTFSIIITVMTTVMIVGTIATEIFAPQFVRWFVKGFTPDKIDLCVRLTRILLPAQIFFYVGGVVSAVLLSMPFPFSGIWPLIYNLFIILGGVVGGRPFRHCIACLWRIGRSLRRPISRQCDRCGSHRDRIPALI